MVTPLKQLELRDIHLPDAVSCWPPAIGWWAVLLLTILLLVALYFLIKKMQQVSVRQMGIKKLITIKADYTQHQNKTILSQALSQLLRQILLSAYPRDEVASVSGEQWLKMLKTSHPKGQIELEWLQTITIASYQNQAEFDEHELLKGIDVWVNSFPKRHLL